jgi:hypothetical protein
MTAANYGLWLSYMSFLKRLLRSALIAPFLIATANAVILDWNTVSWTAGTLSNSYDVDPAKAGNDITVAVSGNTAQLQQELASGNPMTPAITPDFQGGLASPTNTLCLAVNFSNQSQAVAVTVNFSALYTLGVQNVSFTLFDFDFSAASGNNYQDQLRGITATSIDGVTLVAPTITTSANNTLSGSGLTQVVDGTVSTVDTGPGSGNGNVTISFGATAIKSFTFTYGSGSGTVADPTYQHVGITGISFTPVPEVNPAWSAVGSCLLAAALILRHSAKFRK